MSFRVREYVHELHDERLAHVDGRAVCHGARQGLRRGTGSERRDSALDLVEADAAELPPICFGERGPEGEQRLVVRATLFLNSLPTSRLPRGRVQTW